MQMPRKKKPRHQPHKHKTNNIDVKAIFEYQYHAATKWQPTIDKLLKWVSEETKTIIIEKTQLIKLIRNKSQVREPERLLKYAIDTNCCTESGSSICFSSSAATSSTSSPPVGGGRT
eukprot:348125_1